MHVFKNKIFGFMRVGSGSTDKVGTKQEIPMAQPKEPKEEDKENNNGYR
jgi:hypothetical protein